MSTTTSVVHLVTRTAAFALAVTSAFATPPQDDGHPPLAFRTIDGTGNNLLNPDWGSSDSPLLRLTSVAYADGESSPAGADRASARAVSNALAAQSADERSASPVSDFVWQWGQFVDHDIDLTDLATPTEHFDIAVPLDDLWFLPGSTIGLQRSIWTLVGSSPVRQQMNNITAFIDASNVYGSDDVRAAALRLPDGRLKTSAGDLLPFNVDGLPNAPSSDSSFFLAGDVRANEQNGLTAMHTLFVREHNRLVDELAALGLPAEFHYDVARALVGAEMQQITYEEFLPRVLGANAFPPYAGWQSDTNPSIANAFSTGCYRFGHTMLSSTLLRLQPDMEPIAAGHIALQDAFFDPQEIVAHGIAPLLRGLAMQRPQAIDNHVVDDVRNFLFGPPGSGGFDLASLNIQRGRDHGLASYNQTRIDFGLAPAATFADVSPDADVQARLASVYTSPDDIDLWVGMLAEEHVPGALVGELAHTVLTDQFTRLRDGDRFWYETSLPPNFLALIESRTLAEIIRDNTSVGSELPDHVFIRAWLDIGSGLAGSDGTPRLTGEGSLLPDTDGAFVLSGARADALGVFALGFAQADIPFKGGTLVPAITAPSGFLIPFQTDATGGMSMSFTMPAHVTESVALFAQCWVKDDGAIHGVAGSNAVRGDTP